MQLRTILGLVVALVASMSGVGETAEPTPPEQARRLSAEGLTAFHEQRYAEAIAKFQASYALAPRPLLIFDIAQAYRLQGDCVHALEFYLRYQREATAADDRADLEAHVTEVLACATEARPAAAEPAGASATTHAAPTAASRAGVAASAKTPAATGKSAGASAPATGHGDSDRAAAPPGRRPPRLLEAIGAGTAAAGLGGLAVAIYFTVDSARAAASIAQAVKQNSQWGSASELQTDARGRRDDAVAAALYAVGGAALVGGGALFAVGRTRARARAVRMSALPLVGGGMVACSGSF